MKIINGKTYYDANELSDKLDKVILEQSEILSENISSKRKQNNSKKLNYV